MTKPKGRELGLKIWADRSCTGNYRFEGAGTARGFLALTGFLIATDLGYP